MTGALLAAALAVLFWPDARVARLPRLRAIGGLPPGGGRTPLPVHELVRPAAAAVASAGAAALVWPPVVSGLVAVVAFAGVRSWHARGLARRAEIRLLSVGQGLGALDAELRSGRSFEAATEAAVAACADPGSGRALARALRAPEAPPEPGQEAELAAALERVAAGVLLSARTGCSLASVTAALEDDLRARQRLRTELRTATAGARASAVLLAGLPVLGLAMGSGVGADPWAVLTTTGTGNLLLVIGVALELAGLHWSGRLVRRAVR